MMRMIIDDKCDVKNVFEPADWLKDPFDGTFDQEWVAPGSTPGNYHSDEFLIQPIQKPLLVRSSCIEFFSSNAFFWYIASHIIIPNSES